MIKTTELSVKKQERTILDGINLTIPDSGVHGLIGANGAGKTTLLKTFCVTDDYEGEISLHGKKLLQYSLNERAKLLTYCGTSEFQDSVLLVSEIIDYSRFGKNEDVALKKKLTAQFELDSLIDREMQGLSGGEKQRVNLLCSLYQDTRYIFWDEPTNFLDPKHIDLLESLITSYSDTKCFIIVSHDLNFLMEITDHIVALKDGKLLFENSKEEVFSLRKLDDVFDKSFLYLEHEGRFVIR